MQSCPVLQCRGCKLLPPCFVVALRSVEIVFAREGHSKPEDDAGSMVDDCGRLMLALESIHFCAKLIPVVSKLMRVCFRYCYCISYCTHDLISYKEI